MEVKDKVGLQKRKSVTDQFGQGERIILSTKVIKVNKKNKQQERIILVTNTSIYNLVPKEEFGFFSKMVGSRIKRKINFASIYGMTYSALGQEFVIHVPSEYDYRYKAKSDHQEIVQAIIDTFVLIHRKKMPVILKDDLTLVGYCTTDKDRKKGISKMPNDPPIQLDSDEFKAILQKRLQNDCIFAKQAKQVKVGIEDFDLLKVLGRGAFGKVMLCQKKDNQELYAIKSLRKEHIVDKHQVEHTKTERKLMEMIDHPFLVSLEYAFQTEEKLFFVLKFLRGGELFHHLRKHRRFPESTTMFYAAQIVLALEYLHKLGCLYRDLKPENILMGEDGYIQITDFGLAKFTQGKLTYSFVGTPEYLAPEILNKTGHSYQADWYQVGVLIYEMIIGQPPFVHQNQATLFKKIKEQDPIFPPQVSVSDNCKNIILALMKKDQFHRLGHKQGAIEVKAHPWFTSVNFNFDDLLAKKIEPPFKPEIGDKLDVNNFDDEFTREEPINSLVPGNKKMIKQFNQEFGAVTYAGKDLGE